MSRAYQPRNTTCGQCHAEILTYDWDNLQGVYFGPKKVDPTPLTRTDQIACVIVGRPTYALQITLQGLGRLSRCTAANQDRTAKTFAILPAHQCGARYPTNIDTIIPTEVPITTEEPLF